MDGGRSMLAVKGSLGPSPKERHREIENWKVLFGRAQWESNRPPLCEKCASEEGA